MKEEGIVFLLQIKELELFYGSCWSEIERERDKGKK